MQVRELLNAAPPNPPSPHTLLPETVLAIKAWQTVPLDHHEKYQTPEYNKALIWLVRDLLIFGHLHHYQTHKGLKVDENVIAAARLWLFKKPDGTIEKFESLAQPWGYKDIQWDLVEPTTRTVYPDNHSPPPTTFQSLNFDLESLRISKSTMDALRRGTYQPVPLRTIEGSKEQPIEIEDSDDDAKGGVKIKSNDGTSKNDTDNSDVSEDESVTTPPPEREIPWYDPLIHDERGRIIQWGYSTCDRAREVWAHTIIFKLMGVSWQGWGE